MITLSKIQHRNADQILIQWTSQDHPAVFEKLSKLPGLKYTKTHNGWYLPYHARSYESIKRLGFKIHIISTKSGASSLEKRQRVRTGQQSSAVHGQVSPCDAGKEDVSIIFNDRHFRVQFRYDPSIVSQLKKLRGAYWNPKVGCWIVKANLFNLEELQQLFQYWSPDGYDNLRSIISEVEFPREIMLYQVPESVKFVAVKLIGFQIDVAFIKTIPGRKYEKRFNRWLIPADRDIVQRVLEHYTAQDVLITNRLPKQVRTYYEWETSHSEKQKILLKKCIEAHRPEILRMTDVMITQRYSWSTIKAYASALIRFMHFLGSFPIEKGNARDVNRYLSMIASKKVSFTEINRHCSAIKFYYEKVRYRPEFELDKIRRPRSPKTIPKVLSKKQVSMMFGSLTNLKHLTMLYMLYNGGLRSGELIKIRMQDLQWDRGQLFIQGGKGKKDRIVMLGEVLKNMLQEYVEEYQPSYWLFEGQVANKPYSAKSLNTVVKKAAKKAGIVQRVTTHTLRHCFATHLLESGTNIRLIQELLGHKDIKTTLIYTHISKLHVSSVISPLDVLSLKNPTKNAEKG